MPLQNIYLENEGKNFSADERRASWNSEKIVNDPPVPDHSQTLAKQLTVLMTKFVREEWIKSDFEAKEELGLMFTVHRRVLKEILDQPDCEGVRIYFSSKKTDRIRTNLVIKPVDKDLEELDKIKTEAMIKFCEKATECPPETRCPSDSFENFKEDLKNTLSPQ